MNETPTTVQRIIEYSKDGMAVLGTESVRNLNQPRTLRFGIICGITIPEHLRSIKIAMGHAAEAKFSPIPHPSAALQFPYEILPNLTMQWEVHWLLFMHEPRRDSEKDKMLFARMSLGFHQGHYLMGAYYAGSDCDCQPNHVGFVFMCPFDHVNNKLSIAV
jgi:hypothetical protein